ncbi:reverse transcriptase domain-containing protein [Roseomonas sp. KE2513]|uniref:reverse transcriptase domain-containing protein n=1 Tax=Roseomonas sp. KE2513 TaxID=2479202 RepID=UPI001E39E137|nr:reverse transcriptase domain-containing protein [Roseomonas sp. KE2513]
MVPSVDVAGVMPGEQEGTQVHTPQEDLGSPEMGDKVLGRLEALRKANGNSAWVNHDLYRLMFKPGLYVVAYERIKSSPGNMTPGADKQTLDGFSMHNIEKIVSEMRNESFQFSRARRVQIPKPNGGKRPLGIAPPKEKVVQEAIRIILESIYDSPHGSSFSNLSFGFRRGMGPHSALKHIDTNWHGTTWFIEGDIKGCFDNIDHHRLIEILQKRISDQRFLNLIWKALTAGYLEFKTPVNSVIGTPQGSIISPILANIYMHELDVYVEGLRRKYERNAAREYSPEYAENFNALRRARRRLVKADTEEKKLVADEIRRLKQISTTLPTFKDDSRAIRVKYVRYADDWLIGLAGRKELANSIRDEVETFLATDLKLTLSREKTHIRHAKTEEAFFLGTRIKCGSTTPRVITYTRTRGDVTSHVTKRTTNGVMRLFAPVPRLVTRLADKGYCTPEGVPISKPAMSVLEDARIIEEYNAVLTGYLNYYSFAANRSRLRRVAYILQFSAAKTLAHRHQMSMKRVFAKHGAKLNITVNQADGTAKYVALKYPTDWKAKTTAFLVNAGADALDILNVQTNYRTRTKLGAKCCICGLDNNVEMHHVRHIRKGGVNPLHGFDRVMANLNRKQIPVCGACHDEIHAGRYDGKSLSDFSDPHLAAR